MSLSYSKTLFSKQQTSQDFLLMLSFLLCHVFISSCSSFTWPAQHLKDSTPPIGEGGHCDWQQWSKEEQQELPAGQHLDGDILPVQFLELGSLMCLFFWLALETSPCNVLHKLGRCSRALCSFGCELLWHLLAEPWYIDVLRPGLCCETITLYHPVLLTI